MQSFHKSRDCIENIRATASSVISKKWKHFKAIAGRVEKLGAAHMRMAGGEVTTAEGSSSSASSIDSSRSNSRQQANTAARPGCHGNSSTHRALSVGFSSVAPLYSSPTTTTPDCKRTGMAGNARKDISRDAAPYHANIQAPEVFTVDDDSAPNHRPCQQASSYSAPTGSA